MVSTIISPELTAAMKNLRLGQNAADARRPHRSHEPETGGPMRVVRRNHNEPRPKRAAEGPRG